MTSYYLENIIRHMQNWRFAGEFHRIWAPVVIIISFLNSEKHQWNEYGFILFPIYLQRCPKKAVICCTYCDLCPDQQHWPDWAEGWRASGPVWWPSPSLELPPCRLLKLPEQGYGSDCHCSHLHSKPWWLWWSQSSECCCPGPDCCSLWTVLPEGSRTKGFPMVEWSDKLTN